MDVKLEDLIGKIKKDGIEEAEKNRQEIIEKANKQAKSIVESAKKEAEALIKKADDEADKLKDNTENVLKQAARDLVLSLRQQINSLFDGAFKKKIDKELDAKLVAGLIVSIVEKWSLSQKQELEVLVSKADQKRISEVALSALKKEAKEKIEIKTAKSVSKGFMIGLKGEDVFYDFTDESILESLKVFLNPTARDLLDTSPR